MLFGGLGNESLIGGSGKDVLDGGIGEDTASYSEKGAPLSVTLNGATAATVFVGGAAEDAIKNLEDVVGGGRADRLTGDGFDNTLIGSGGNDILKGRGGVDTLTGGQGKDVLTGGRWPRPFLFQGRAGCRQRRQDHRFCHGADTILLAHAIFTNISCTPTPWPTISSRSGPPTIPTTTSSTTRVTERCSTTPMPTDRVRGSSSRTSPRTWRARRIRFLRRCLSHREAEAARDTPGL